MKIIQYTDVGYGKRECDQMAAVRTCLSLLIAYRNGKLNGGSMDWSDVDAAYELAKQALGLNEDEE